MTDRFIVRATGPQGEEQTASVSADITPEQFFANLEQTGWTVQWAFRIPERKQKRAEPERTIN